MINKIPIVVLQMKANKKDKSCLIILKVKEANHLWTKVILISMIVAMIEDIIRIWHRLKVKLVNLLNLLPPTLIIMTDNAVKDYLQLVLQDPMSSRNVGNSSHHLMSGRGKMWAINNKYYKISNKMKKHQQSQPLKKQTN